MSQYPPGQGPYGQYPQEPYAQGQYPPAQYAQPYVPGYATATPPGQRPASVTALAVIGIVLGSLGTLCLGCGTIMSVIQLAGGDAMMSFGGPQPRLSRGAEVFNAVASVLELVLWILVLAASIGALSLKPASRRLAINWSYAMIAWAAFKTAVQVAWIGPETLEAVEQMQAATPGPRATPQMMNWVTGLMTAGTIVMFLIYVALPVCFLIWWNKAHVRAAFEGAGAAGGAAPAGYGPGAGPGGYPPAGYPQ